MTSLMCGLMFALTQQMFANLKLLDFSYRKSLAAIATCIAFIMLVM